MTSRLLVPSRRALVDTMGMLYGDGVKVGDDTPPPNGDAVCAVYVNDDDRPIAAILCDTAFAAYAGSSLSMLPPAGAEEAVESGELSETVMDNVHEVMNICSNLFMDDSTPHLRLSRVYRSLADAPEEAKAVVTAGDGPVFKVDIPRYGTGVLRLLS